LPRAHLRAADYAAGEFQVRADRADRREHAGHRDRPTRPHFREGGLQHAGSGGARRKDHPHHRSQGRAAQSCIKTIETILPDVPETSPIIYALPIQMLAYFTAVFMGIDIDQPRNLAKSVTVE